MAGLNSIEGLASNLNTTDIINATIEYERRSAVLMERNQAERTQELTTFKALSARLLAIQTSIRNLNDRKSFSQSSISISNENLLTATADGIVSAGTYSLNILSLARNHQVASQGFNDPTQTVMGTGTILLALGNQSATTITISEGENSLVGIKNAINNADAGITASIINDGTSSNAYRLVLTGDRTGRQERISITSSLTGGLNLDYDSASFDNPEELDFSALATTELSLGATADYTGTTNKIFTFTVAGSGAQTIGNGNITIDWTDGTNSGSIVVSEADTEVTGPEGLKLSFIDGDLVGGDTFQVSAFAPLLQQASDAQVSMGSSNNGASPIVINSNTNEFEDIIPGLTLNVTGVTTETTGPVIIETGLNTDGIKNNIKSFISAYNSAMDFIDTQFDYNAETEEAGVLLGDATLLSIQSRIRNMLSEPITGLDQSRNTLSSIGIRTNSQGKLAIVNSAKLTEALENDFESVLELFVDNGSASVTGISFVNASSEIEGGSTFDINITQAATHGYLQGQNLNDPSISSIVLTSDSNRLKFRIDGILSEEIVLTAGTYTSGEDLANELQTRINADDRIGALGVSVEWVDLGDSGYFKLTSSSYGSTSKVENITSIPNNALSKLGLANASVSVGRDVAGTINGESATGSGQVLTGDEDNATSDGLKIKVTLTSSDLGAGDEGTITVTRGLSSVIGDGLNAITDAQNGVIARKTSSLQKQIDSIKDYIEDFDERLMRRRESLVLKWTELESVLSQLQAEGSFLESQLTGLSSNLSQILGN